MNTKNKQGQRISILKKFAETPGVVGFVIWYVWCGDWISEFNVFWPSFRLEQFGMSLSSSSMVMAVGGVFSGITGILLGIGVSRNVKKEASY